MQMIDVLKRLAELDAKNPNVLKENQQVDECGMMGDMKSSYDRPSTPASINMTAASGEELGELIKSIANLSRETMGHDHDHEETPLSAMPSIGVSAMDDNGDIRSMIDKLNDIEDEKTQEAYDTTPNDPNNIPPFDSEKYAHHENPPGADRKGNANNPRAYDTNENFAHQLYQDYQKFLAEDDELGLNN